MIFQEEAGDLSESFGGNLMGNKFEILKMRELWSVLTLIVS